jgi:formate hydrogenlyase transcriptional activator
MALTEPQPESFNIQRLVDSIPALIHTARPDGDLDYFNKPWLDYLGANLDDVAGWKWTAFIHPDDVEGIVARWRACLATGEIFEYETRVRRANREYRWMFHRKVPLRDANGTIVKWHGSSLDIEDRKRAEALRSAEKRLLEMTATDVTLERILDVLCLFIEEQRSGTLASVLLLNPDGVYLRFAAGPGIPNEWKQQMERMPIGPCAGSCGTAAYTGSPVIVSDIATDPLWEVPEHRASALKHGLRASWSSPVLSSKGKVLGTFCMYYREPRSPGAQDLELIKSATHLVGVAIERDRAKQALRRSQAYLTEAQRLSHTGSFGWNVSMDEHFWSDETFRIFEFTPSSKISLPMILDRVHPQDRPLAETAIIAATRGEGIDLELRLLMPDGRIKYLHVVGNAETDNTGSIEIIGAVMNVTERRLAQEAIRRSEAYLAEGQRVAHTGSWAFGAAGFEYWSSELFRIYGLDPSGKPPTVEEYLDLVHPEDREFMEQGIQKMLADHREFDFTKRIVRPDGKTRFVRCVGVPRIHGETLLGFFGTGMDVTEQAQLAEELRRSEAFLLEAQRLSRTGSWRHDLQSGTVTTSPEMLNVFGVEPGEDHSSPEFWFDRIHPEDRNRVQSIFERSEVQKTNYEADYRIVLPDGSIKYQHSAGHPVLNESGQLAEFVGTAMDVTEQHLGKAALKNAFNEIKKSKADLLEAQRLSYTGSWRHDVLTGIVTISPEVHRIFDIKSEEDAPTAENFFGRIHPEDRPVEAQNYERANLAKTDFELDYRIVLPDGTIKHVHHIGHPVLNESGDIREFVGTVIDITERKGAEEERRRNEMELRQIVELVPQLIAVYGPNRERLYANRTALNYLGISLDEWRHKSFAASAHPDDSERLKTYTDRALSSGAVDELELRLRKRDGSYRWFLARFNPLRDEQGQIIRWYYTGTDIEERKQAEDTLRLENVVLREEIDRASMFEEIVGTSPALKAVLSRISKVAPSNSTVLVTGETGTGKELVARAIHRRSDRSTRAFVSVNCAAIPRDLIASELFGHEKGAFTGAIQQRLGRFELASRGTLFLDEVGELPIETQIALLRVLQEHEFERVGGTRPIRTDVRVIAATNRDLKASIDTGSFRRDLFYRLNVFPIEIPPLRERKEDIRLLVEYFIDRYARKAGKNFTTVEKKTLRSLESYPWPGNIRELQNVIERSVIVCETENFSVDESWLSQQPSGRKAESHLYLSEKVAAQEKEIIEAALRECQGRVSGPSGAAAKLGVVRSTLESKIRSLKINKNRFRI